MGLLRKFKEARRNFEETICMGYAYRERKQSSKDAADRQI
jgi:hypothetical protein